MARKTTESIIAAAVALGGIFGLIVDAPDVFALAVKVFTAPSEWLREMNSTLGYWLLIIGGIASLAWIHFGDKIRPSWWDRIAGHFRPTIGHDQTPATHGDLVKIAHAIADSSDFASKIVDLSKDATIKEIQLMLLRDVMPELNRTVDRSDALNRAVAQILATNIDALVLERVRIAVRALSALDRIVEPTSAEDIQPFCDSADKAIYAARRILDNTVALSDLRIRLQQSENRADYMLEHKEVTVPAHISELQYRKFLIAKTQLEDAVAQLESTAVELEEKLRFHTDQLKEFVVSQ